MTSSPALGAPDRPSTSTGIEGPASLTLWPASLSMARTRPYSRPLSIISPLRSVPLCTSTVATGPRPLSSRDSITTPLAEAIHRRVQLQHFGLHQDLVEQLVDTQTGFGGNIGKQSIATPFFGDDALRRQFALDAFWIGAGLVHLVDRHHQRHPGGAGVLDGFLIVCGITPSSAATTSTTTSVALAPRARMAVNAA
jgi:hypothetical protein